MTVLLVIAGIVGWVGGRFAFEQVASGIGKKVAEAGKPAGAGEPTMYDGPTFSVRLPGPVGVQHLKEQGVELAMYGSELDDGYIGVAVSDLSPGDAYDFRAGAEGIRGNIGGRIASDTALEVAGRPAHDLMITGVEDGRATNWTRIIVDDRRVYQIAAVLEGNQTERPAEYVAALDSFVMR